MSQISSAAVAHWPDLSDAHHMYFVEPKTAHYTDEMAYNIGHRLFSQAGIETIPRRARMAISGNRVVVVWKGPLWKQVGAEGSLLRVQDSQYIPLTRLPAVLAESAAAVVGPGYIMLVPLEEAEAIEQAIKLHRQAYLTEKVLLTEDAPLPRQKALGFKRYSVSTVPHKKARFVDLGGNIWEAVGIKPGDPILMTRYKDGVMITKAETGTRKLARRVTHNGLVQGHKRLGENLIRGLVAESARVLFTNNSLLLLGDSVKLAEFGLTEKSYYAGIVPVKDGALDQTPRPSVVNFSVYPLNRKAPRIQVQGEWLTRYGFKPGVKFSLEPHPLVRGRVLVRVDPEGSATVTQHSRPGSSKLYIPTKMLEHFSSPDIRVWGNFEGLHVQQHFKG